MRILAKYNATAIERIEPVQGARVFAGPHSIVAEMPEVVNELINQGFNLETQIKPKLEPLFSTESELDEFLETI